MQHFQSILIIIGIVAIGGVLIHGYLLSRKEKMDTADSEEGNQHAADKNDMFAEPVSETVDIELTDDVVSEVRIMGESNDQSEPLNIDFGDALNDEQIDPVDFNDSKIDSEPVIRDIDEPIRSIEEILNISTDELLNVATDEHDINDAELPYDESLDNVLEEPLPVINVETETEEYEAVIDAAEIEEEAIETLETLTLTEIESEMLSNATVAADRVEVVEEVAEKKRIQPTDLFIFNVAAKEDRLLGGHELLQFFLTAGLRFGDMSIFHRHEFSDGTGPVLFSVTNMMAPGVFDPDTMEQFKSEGVSFFLTVPNEHIDIKNSFDMMLRAVEQMAEEFDCDVLNAEREKMTREDFMEYNNRLLHYI